MSSPEKDTIINKFMCVEQWAYRGRHLVEIMDKEKIKFACKRIRHDLEDLEVLIGIEE
jgi:hypothetical protein